MLGLEIQFTPVSNWIGDQLKRHTEMRDCQREPQYCSIIGMPRRAFRIPLIQPVVRPWCIVGACSLICLSQGCSSQGEAVAVAEEEKGGHESEVLTGENYYAER